LKSKVSDLICDALTVDLYRKSADVDFGL